MVQVVGPRRALSLFVLGFCTTIFIMVGVAQGGAWARCFYALAAAYGLGFFAVASEWFWARWYTMGIAGSGVSMALLGLVTNGWNPGLAIWGGVHLLIYAPLMGEAMADRYENQEAWRRRYGLDEHGVVRIKKAVKGAATALPTLIFFGLAPREGALFIWALPLLAAVGLWGVLRMRFWGVALMGGVAAWAAIVTAMDARIVVPFADGAVGLAGLGILAVASLLWAVSPFVLPAYRFVRQQR